MKLINYHLPKSLSRVWVLTFALLFGNVSLAETVEIELQITANGAHPSNGQWDGSRIYYPPFEISNITPPDIVVVIVQPDRVQWYTSDEFRSRCPDAEQCKLDRVAIDIDHPVGLVVFDHDPILELVLDPSSKVLDLATAQMNELAAYSLDKRWNRISSLIERGTGWLDSIQTDVQFLTDKSYDWMDAVILLPSSVGNTVEIRKVEERMRAVIRDSIRPLLLTSEEPRISGPIEYTLLENCVWPAPACNQPYVSIALVEREGGTQ